MPIYEFYCLGCKKNFETIVSLANRNPIRCEYCGSTDIQKKVSSFGIGGGGNRIKAGNSCVSCTSSNCSTCK